VANIPRKNAHKSIRPPSHQLQWNFKVQSESDFTPDKNLSSFKPHPSSVTNTIQLRTLELRLMYHYTTIVSQTMPYCGNIPAKTWQISIPQLAFEYETVLNPMLAISALHLHVHSPNDSVMAIAMRRYLGRALMNHRNALPSPGEDLSDQLWLSATILSHMYWLLAHQAQPNEKFELPLQAFTLLEGISILSMRNRDHNTRLDYQWTEHKDMVHIKPEAELSIAAQVQLRSINEELAALLDAFNISSLPEEDQKVYMEVKDYVLYHYQAYYSGTASQHLQRFVAYMVIMCRPRYRVMLEEHDPLAMGLMARILVLLCGLDHAWWVNGGGEYEVVERDIRGIRELMPEPLRWVMDWPCRVLNRELILSRDEQKEKPKQCTSIL
jgi:Fungal specific transcription factor domain